VNQSRILLALCFGALIVANAQTLSTHKVLGRYQQFVWQDQHGLPQNGVLAILRSRDGYLWLGTIEGAARFDGVRFVVFDSNNTPAIKSNQILSLAEDRAGDLWLGAVSGGLTRYAEGRSRLYTTRDGLSSDFVRCLLADRAGNLWVGTRGGGLNLFRDERFTAYTTRDGLPGDQITALAEDARGGLWIGTTQGLAHFEPGRITAYTTRDGLPHEKVNALWVESAGELWVGTGGGLCRFQQGRFVVEDLPTQSSVTALFEDRQRNLWVGTHGKGLFLRRGGRFLPYTVRDGLSSDTVLALYQDPEGDLWVGTVDGGLCQLREGRFTSYMTEDGLPHNWVTAVFEDSQGSLWLGTRGGLGRFKDGAITPYTTIRGLPENDSIAEDRAGNLWFSAGGKLTQFRDGQFTPWTSVQGLPHESVRELLGDRAGNLWLSTPGHGLTQFQAGRFRGFDTRDGLADNEVTALYEGRSGQLWVGTRNGSISRFEAETQGFTTWTAKDGLPGNQVLSFYEDRAGALWIGTNGSGLCRFQAGKFATITVNDGLYDNLAHQILSDTEDDSGDLWMSGNRGIYRASLRELNDFADGRLKSVTSFVYGAADGMMNRECNGASPAGWKTRDGRLWFPTVKGAVVLDPKQRNLQPSLVAIERIILDRVPVPAGHAVQVRPDQENLEIEYTGLNWRRPQQIRFKYQLVGFNHDWVEAGTRRTAYFSGLPPGDYTFQVVADNGEGLWNMEGARLRIVVLPPFYRTWWFLTLAALSVVGIVFAAFKYRVRQIEQREAAQQAFSQQLIESQEVERKRIAAELHDSLGQQLLVIKNWAMIGLNVVNGDTQTREPLAEISTTASQAIDDVRQVVYDLRPYQLDKIGLVNTLRFMIEKVGAAAGIAFQTEFGAIDQLFTYNEQVTLYRIVQECVNNIVKHSQASVARVVIEPQGTTVQVQIEDNGRGFVAAQRQGNGFGLKGLHERVRMLKGELMIHSAPGSGTKIHITLDR
jgi:ligand-binding sensor domain-containing protein/signal transduction histidine kinase